MKPGTKIIVFIFALILPYIALVVYLALRNPDHPFPGWFPYFGLTYILATLVATAFYSRRVRRNARPKGTEKPKTFWLNVGRAWMAYLVLLWSGGFLWGAYQTFEGKYDWRRAVPAGAFLLVLIGIFSLALYRDLGRHRKQKTVGDEKTTSG